MANASWERQRKELRAYNTFYSAFTGRASDISFSDKGFYIRGLFVTIPSIEGEDVDADFVLYDGDTVLIAEIKSGNNFNEGDIDQMRRASNLSIEAAEKFLDNNATSQETPYEGLVERVEPCIVYSGIHEAYVANCRENWPDCRSNLEQLEALSPVLAQGRGGTLRVVAGEFENRALDRWLNNGIDLPKNPKTEFFLTDGMERESIGAAICGVWGQRAVKGSEEVTVTLSDVRSHFDYRPLPIERVAETLRILDHIGACERNDEKRSDRCYVFKPNYMETVLNIGSIFDKKSAEQYLDEVGGRHVSDEQSGLGEFSEEDEEDPDDD